MQRYFLETKNKFNESDMHHIKNVMRMKTGDEVIVCYDKICDIVKLDITKNDVEFTIVRTLESKESFNITLFQGLPKGPKIETTIKYASMFGANSIVITEMERSISKLSHVSNKLKRFEAIAKEASELAHRNNVPDISFLSSIKNIKKDDFDVIVLADEDQKQLTIEDLKINDKSLKIALIIGPEGGISSNERTYLDSIGAKIITLGHNILSSEIASVAFLSFFLTKA